MQLGHLLQSTDWVRRFSLLSSLSVCLSVCLSLFIHTYKTKKTKIGMETKIGMDIGQWGGAVVRPLHDKMQRRSRENTNGSNIL